MFIKTALKIQTGDIEFLTWDANDFSGSNDMDNLYGTLSFTLPYNISNSTLTSYSNQTNASFNVNRLKRDMLVTLYYIELESDRQVELNEMTVIFDGRINKVELDKSKTDITYTVSCEGTLSYSNAQPPIINVVETRVEQMPNFLLQRANLQTGPNNILIEDNPSQVRDLIPSSKVNIYFSRDIGEIIQRSVKGSDMKEIISNFKDKNGCIFIQQLSGEVDVVNYSSLLLQDAPSLEAFEFNVDDNIFDLNYGDMTSDIDAVIVYGFGVVFGEAIDLLKLQSKGITANNKGKYDNIKFYRMERRDLLSTEACQKVAREKLLELNKNYIISFSTKFSPLYKIGSPFTLIDNDLYTGTELFFIKSISWTIGKGVFDCDITGFANSLTTLPENFVISSTGVADTDVVGLTNKVAGSDWVDFG